jgi:acyl-CoA synthetase (AMP-forming)/AMP-acid ligase II
VEEYIEALPYIDKVMVVPVPDTLCQHLVGAITWPSTGEEEITLQRLRNDLYHAGVSQYKLPTVLHRARVEDQFPYTKTGKPAKKAALETYFPHDYQSIFPEGRIQSHTESGSFKQIPGQSSAYCAPFANRAWDQGGVYF